MNTFIYSLEYPLGNIRYIGKSDNPEERYLSHLKDAENLTISHKLAWLNSLLKKDIKPFLKIIDKVPIGEWQFWEKYWISQFKTWGFNLTNSTEGGDGLVNPTKEVKDRIAESLKKTYENGLGPWNKGIQTGYIPWNKGESWPEETLNKISKTIKEGFTGGRETWNKGKKTGHIPWNKGKKGVMPEPWNKGKKGLQVAWNKGITPSKESIEKAVLNHPGRREVLQFDLQGNFIAEFISVGAATEFINCNGISRCCKGLARSAGGFLWLFKNDYQDNNKLIEERVLAFKNKSLNMSRGKGVDNVSSKAVVQLTLSGDFIEIFDSIKEAQEILDIKSGIGAVCRGIRETAGGFRWEFLDNFINGQAN